MRFIHTSDWQLGLKLNFVPGEAGARLRAQRFETVRRIAGVARERGVDAVVVAGDVFDDNGVGPDTIQQTQDALAAFAPLPVLLLPGNHDSALPGSALHRLQTAGHVRVLGDREPIALGGGVLYPCPLFQRHSREDPTAHLPTREAGDTRPGVVAAHGGVLDFGETTETPNRIDVARVLAKGYEYLALGDWHGALQFTDRAWYCGTPEQTRFSEKNTGYVLFVEIEGQGIIPRVERIPVGRAQWRTHVARFYTDSDVDSLSDWFDAPELERSWTLVSLELEGQLSLSARGRLEVLLAEEKGRLLHLQVARDAVVDAPSEEDLRVLTAEGFVGEAAESLQAQNSTEARDALRLLHRLLVESSA